MTLFGCSMVVVERSIISVIGSGDMSYCFPFAFIWVTVSKLTSRHPVSYVNVLPSIFGTRYTSTYDEPRLWAGLGLPELNRLTCRLTFAFLIVPSFFTHVMLNIDPPSDLMRVRSLFLCSIFVLLVGYWLSEFAFHILLSRSAGDISS